MSPTDFFIEVLLNSFGLWLIRQLYDNDHASAERRRPHRSGFSNTLFPSSNSFFVFKKFSRQQQRPWMDTLMETMTGTPDFINAKIIEKLKNASIFGV